MVKTMVCMHVMMEILKMEMDVVVLVLKKLISIVEVGLWVVQIHVTMLLLN
jgi:hypothetical protein